MNTSGEFILGFCGFISTDFSTYYLDLDNNYPNSLIPANGSETNFEGIYNNIYVYNSNGSKRGDRSIGNYSIILNIPKSLNYVNNKGFIQLTNYEEWNISDFSVSYNNVIYSFKNISFSPIINTNNDSKYNLINKYKGYTFSSTDTIWYNNKAGYPNTFKLIYGQGDIPLEYYDVCGLNKSTATNPFTRVQSEYYDTYITTNSNYSTNSGWIIILISDLNLNLINPPFISN